MALPLNYPGDQRHIVGEVKGPDTCGGLVRAVSAQYDADQDKTRVSFRRMWGDELTAYLASEPLAPIETAGGQPLTATGGGA